MKRIRAVLVLVLVVAVSLSLPGATSLAQEVLTNDSVVQMVKAGLPEAIVIAKIKGTAIQVRSQDRLAGEPEEGRRLGQGAGGHGFGGLGHRRPDHRDARPAGARGRRPGRSRTRT